MTREEAIQVLESMKSEESYNALIDLCNMAISALSAEEKKWESKSATTSATTDCSRESIGTSRTDGDLISRADALEAIKNAKMVFDSPKDGFVKHDISELVSTVLCEVIHDVPSVSAEAVHGEWIEAQIDTAEFPINFLECSACGYRIGRETYLENTFTYCPSCGARMTPYKGGGE